MDSSDDRRKQFTIEGKKEQRFYEKNFEISNSASKARFDETHRSKLQEESIGKIHSIESNSR